MLTNFAKFIGVRILTVCLTPKPIVFPPYHVAAVNSKKKKKITEEVAQCNCSCGR